MKEILDIVVTIFLVIIAWIDHKTMKIPDMWNLLLGVCGIAAIILGTEITVLDRVIGAFCVSVPMFLLTLWIPDAFGGGDIKFSFAMGLYLGWKNLLLGTYFAIMFGGIQAVYLLVIGKAKMGEGAHMAFGPSLCLGFFIATWWGDSLLPWYLGLFY